MSIEEHDSDEIDFEVVNGDVMIHSLHNGSPVAKRQDAIALAKHFGLFDELEERATNLAIAGNAVVDLVDNKYALSIAISSWKGLIKELTNEQN